MIWTADLLSRKRPLYQLSHNCRPWSRGLYKLKETRTISCAFCNATFRRTSGIYYQANTISHITAVITAHNCKQLANHHVGRALDILHWSRFKRKAATVFRSLAEKTVSKPNTFWPDKTLLLLFDHYEFSEPVLPPSAHFISKCTSLKNFEIGYSALLLRKVEKERKSPPDGIQTHNFRML